MTSNNFFPTQGEVIERISKKKFWVRCDNGKVIDANVPDRFRNKNGRRRAHINVGDRVVVEIILRDPGKGEIISLVE
jgi:translation initiation factor IF-1